MNEDTREITGSLSFLCLFTSLSTHIFHVKELQLAKLPFLLWAFIGPHGVGCATRALYSGLQACLSEALSTCARR